MFPLTPEEPEKMKVTPSYAADIYLRLSKEDGDKEESDSIGNQRALILDFLQSMPDITVHKIRIDDGYSGVDFDRPRFKEMMADIQAGVVNCVIVKDFSRFGRNYIEAGKYIQLLFPRAGVRFIAVNDAYDSAKTQSYTNNIIVPFKNMVNDAYSADISMKVRSHLDVKRRKGAFVGAFAMYGYRKQEEDKNKLAIDDFAADVVRDIFQWKIDGLSPAGIACELNTAGILSPLEYKRYLGMKYQSNFKLNPTAQWTAKAVFRILQNAVYTGLLEQGKRTKPNYKIRALTAVPKEQWICRTDTHDAIVPQTIFDTVQHLLKQDTRAATKGSPVYPLAGVIVCGDCGGAMVRKTNTKGGRRYPYYVCATHRADTSVCATHNIAAATCEQAVLRALRTHVSALLNPETIAPDTDSLSGGKNAARKLHTRLAAKQEEIRRYHGFRLSLFESYQEGILSKEDFVRFKTAYDVKISEVETVLLLLEEEIERLALGGTDPVNRLERFEAFSRTETLERRIVAALVESAAIHQNGRMIIRFRHRDEYSHDKRPWRVSPSKPPTRDFIP